MADVRWSSGALDNLDAIGDYHSRVSPQYARSLVSNLYRAAEALAPHPALGRVVPEFEVTHVREIVRNGYRLIYLVSDDAVEVLAVVHSHQDLRRALRRE